MSRPWITRAIGGTVTPEAAMQKLIDTPEDARRSTT